MLGGIWGRYKRLVFTFAFGFLLRQKRSRALCSSTPRILWVMSTLHCHCKNTWSLLRSMCSTLSLVDKKLEMEVTYPRFTHPALQGSIKTTKWRRKRGPILTICLPISCPASSHTDTDLGTRARLCGFPTPGSRSALSQDLFPGYLSCRAWELSWVPARNRLATVASGVLQ